MMNRFALNVLTVTVFCYAMTISFSTHAAFTQAQSEKGAKHYPRYCGECHGLNLKGSAHGPALSGPNFLKKWGNHPTGDLFALISETMSAGIPASMRGDIGASITAHILRSNGAIAGDEALQAGMDQLIGVAIKAEGWDSAMADAPEAKSEKWEGAGSIAEAARKASGFVNQEVADFSPVTEKMLADPSASDWLSWRRTLDGHGYSPLQKVNRGNVNDLKLAWVLTMHDGSNQATPLVHDGIMYLTHPQNVIQALDAATGDLVWEYTNEYEPGSQTLGGPTRTIAIFKDRLFMATYDAAIVAVDARTGKQLWKSVKADWNKGFTHTSGPIIAGGVVISGINGCERYKPEGCFITGHDPDSGEELWRTSTIALPGDPNDASWGGLPVELRAGSDTWIPGSYDPELELFYIGTSQAKSTLR